MTILDSLRSAVGVASQSIVDYLRPKQASASTAPEIDEDDAEEIVERRLRPISVFPRGSDRPAPTPPGGGRYPVAHAVTFSGMFNTVAKVYRQSDEALRDSLANARMMRTDCAIMESLEARQRAVALLKWRIDPENPEDPRAKERCTVLTKLIERIPDFLEYRRSLLEALWYGRAGNSQRFARVKCGGREYWSVGGWKPVNGDKLVFKFGLDEDDHLVEDTIGVRVMDWQTKDRDGGKAFGDRSLEITDRGFAYFLRGADRQLLAIHKHIIEDGAYEDPLSAGRIHGVGIRDRIYWAWYLQKETMATIMEVIERCGTGFTIYYYQSGSEASYEAVKKIAAENTGNNRILVPRLPDDPNPPIDRIEPSTAGVEALRSIVHEYFGHQIKRYIVGQTMTSEPAGAGLGSTLAEVQLGTFLQIVQYDATKLSETLTRELLTPIKNFNFPEAADEYDRFVIETEGDGVKERIDSFKAGWEMGLKIPARVVSETLNIREPEPGEEVLSNQPAADPQGMGAGMGGGTAPPAETGTALDRIDDLANANLAEGDDEDAGGDPDDMGSPEDRAAAMADIMAGSFGDHTNAWMEKLLSSDRQRYEASGVRRLRYAAWNPSDHPRGPGGRFIPKGSPEALSATSDRIRQLASGPRSSESAGELLSHLNLLTTKQLHELKRTHGISASGRVKADLVAKLAQRLGSGDHQRAKRPDGTPVAPLVRDVHTVPTESLHVDPSRFQYKVSGIGEGGVGQELKGTSQWSPELGGTLLVWRDPEDGKDYVVNGHHRHELSRRTGNQSMNVRYINAPTAQEARARGALANIAEGRGTALDAAKYLRDTGADVEHLRRAGISLSGKVASDASILTRLGQRAFQGLTEGRIDEAKAVAVAKHLTDADLQDALFKRIDDRENDGKEWTTREIEQAAKKMAGAGKVVEQKADLFGMFEDEKSTFDQEVEIESYVSQALSREVKDFGAVANQRRADRVASAGNVLSVEENARRAATARGDHELFDQQSQLKGPVSAAVKKHAAALAVAKSKKDRERIKTEALEDVRKAIAEVNNPSGADPSGGSVAPSPDAGAASPSGGGASGNGPAREPGREVKTAPAASPQAKRQARIDALDRYSEMSRQELVAEAKRRGIKPLDTTHAGYVDALAEADANQTGG